jgi:hypothetical protein
MFVVLKRWKTRHTGIDISVNGVNLPVQFPQLTLHLNLKGHRLDKLSNVLGGHFLTYCVLKLGS